MNLGSDHGLVYGLVHGLAHGLVYGTRFMVSLTLDTIATLSGT